MTLAALALMSTVGWSGCVVVILRVLSDNRRLTAALVAPRPMLAHKALVDVARSKSRSEASDERPSVPVGG